MQSQHSLTEGYACGALLPLHALVSQDSLSSTCKLPPLLTGILTFSCPLAVATPKINFQSSNAYEYFRGKLLWIFMAVILSPNTAKAQRLIARQASFITIRKRAGILRLG